MKYFIIEDNRQQGPFTIYELKDKGISSDTLVWAEGMPDWMPAWKVEELKNFLYNTTDKSTPPPYTPPAEAESEQRIKDSGTIKTTKKSSHSGCLITSLIILGVGIFLAITNPGKQKHTNLIKERVLSAIENELTKSNSLALSGYRMVGKPLLNRVADGLLEECLDYHDYLVFSTTTLDFDGKTHTVSYGAVEKIFTMNEDDIAKFLKENLKSLIPAPTTNIDAGQPSASVPDDNGLEQDIQEELINSVGRIIKKQVQKNTDSTTSKGVGKVIDDIIDLIQ